MTNGATRRARLETKEGAIVEAAYEMFATKGFAKSTMVDIAKAAGVAEGTVYLYFNNKEALAGGVIEKFYAQLTETARQGVGQLSTTAEKLRFLAHHHLSGVMKERRILDLLMVVERDIESSASGAIYEMNKRYVAIFDEVVREGVWRGDISEHYTHWILRDIFYGGLEYAMKTILITGRKQAAEKFPEELVRMIISTPQTEAGDTDGAEKRLARLAQKMEGFAERMEAVLPPRGNAE